MTIQCCQCKKVKAGSAWTYPVSVEPVTVSHSYCPICLDEAMAEVRAERDYANRSSATPHCLSAA